MARVTVRRRHGFTLIELLIVIAIIAMLATLLLSALFKAKARAEDLDARKDVTDLHQSVITFITDHRLGAVGFMPSSFDPTGGDAASASYISRIFPKSGGKLNVPKPAGGKLEGSQCLVFFLRGPILASGQGGQGWSVNPKDPTLVGGERIGPFYDFKDNRLKPVPDPTYPAYTDRFSSTIVYYSPFQFNGQAWMPNAYNAQDNQSLGLKPYYSPLTGLGQNMDTFQIISAGRNTRFGKSGDTWLPTMAGYVYPMGSDGFDDIANFSSATLGALQQ